MVRSMLESEKYHSNSNDCSVSGLSFPPRPVPSVGRTAPSRADGIVMPTSRPRAFVLTQYVQDWVTGQPGPGESGNPRGSCVQKILFTGGCIVAGHPPARV